MSKPEGPPQDIQSALSEIAVLEAQLHATGAVDTERDQIASLRKRLLNRTIEPHEAVRQVQLILQARSEYH